MRSWFSLALLLPAAGCGLFGGDDGGGKEKNPRPLHVVFLSEPQPDVYAGDLLNPVEVGLFDDDGELVEDLSVEFFLTTCELLTGETYVLSTGATATFTNLRIKYPGNCGFNAQALVGGIETYDWPAPTFQSLSRFDQAVVHEAGRFPSGSAVGDLDGDGDLDIATANEFSHDVTVLLNDGAGVFTSAPPIPVPSNPQDIAVLPLVGDPLADIVVGANSALTVLKNDGAMVFTTSLMLSPNFVTWLGTADVGTDGTLDLLSVGYTSATVYAPTAGLSPASVTFSVPPDTRRLSTGDFGGNSRLDLLATSPDNTIDWLLSILLADDVDSWNAPMDVPGSIDFAYGIAADVDGTGGSDVIAVDVGDTPGIAVLLDSAGTLVRVSTIVDAAIDLDGQDFLELGDFDADGLLDLAYTFTTTGFTWRGLGDGTFALWHTFSFYPGTEVDFDVADLDGDGDDDAVVTLDGDPGSVAVILNRIIP